MTFAPSVPDGTRHTVSFVHEQLAPCRLVDVGGGDGLLAICLAGLGFDVVVVEPNEDRAAVARSRGVHVIASDVLELQRQSAEAILFSRSLHHMSDPWRALRGARQALALGGTLLIEDFGRDLVNQSALEWRYLEKLRDCDGACELGTEASTLSARWVSEHPPAHVLSSRVLVQAVEEVLPGAKHSTVPYLYRYLLEERLSSGGSVEGSELRLAEHRRIQAGKLPAIGLRWSWRRSRHG